MVSPGVGCTPIQGELSVTALSAATAAATSSELIAASVVAPAAIVGATTDRVGTVGADVTDVDPVTAVVDAAEEVEEVAEEQALMVTMARTKLKGRKTRRIESIVHLFKCGMWK